MAQDAETNKAAQDAAEKAKAEAAALDAGADDLGDARTVDLVKFARVVEDRRRKNAENQELRARLAAADEKLSEHAKAEEEKRLAGLADLDRERELRKKAEDAAAAAKAEALRTQRTAACKVAGVDPEYLDVVEPKLAAAMAADPKLDPDAWLQDQRIKKPALFGARPAEPASGGPQRAGVTDPRVVKLEAELKTAVGEDRIWKQRELRKLLEQKPA